MLKKSKIQGFSYIRVIATLLVLLGHCTTLAYGIPGHSVDVFATKFMRVRYIFDVLFCYIYSFHMPLFVTLSGALFETKSINIKMNLVDFLYKKSTRLLVPYFVFAIFIFLPVRIYIGYYKEPLMLMDILCNDIVLGKDVNYLWYLMMLIEVYSVFFVLKKYTNLYNFNNKKLFLLLLLLNIISFRIGELSIQMHKTLEFMLWFYVGGVLFKNLEIIEKVTRKRKLVFFILQLILFVLYYCITKAQSDTTIHIYILKAIKEILRILLTSAGIILTWSIAFGIKAHLPRILSLLEVFSFEIYLLHVPLITLYSWFVQETFKSCNVSDYGYITLIMGKFFVGLLGSLLVIKVYTYITTKSLFDSGCK